MLSGIYTGDWLLIGVVKKLTGFLMKLPYKATRSNYGGLLNATAFGGISLVSARNSKFRQNEVI